MDDYLGNVHDSTRLGQPVVIKGISRRLGAGVSSYPNDRFYVLVEGLTEARDDDMLLEVKQAIDPLRFTGFAEFPNPPFENDAKRVVDMQQNLQASDDNDPLLGYARVPPYEFRVRERSAFQTLADPTQGSENV